MRLVSGESWLPHGVDSLEPNAWRALKSLGNTLIVAGPGSGKTELLAQRATFLLETGACAAPHRILAISFKTDAAENLAARVKKRCDPVLARRFVSLTFDAFTKSILDRFFSAVPDHWRPTRPYDILTPARRDVDAFLERMRLSTESEEWRAQIVALGSDLFQVKDVGTIRLSSGKPNPRSGRAFAVLQWWNEHLRRSNLPSQISFVMINRLAELIVRTNPEVARAMLATFRFVFVDEFQDTTYAQYDFLRSVFVGSRVSLSAVGDNKQRIMVWAGAIPDIFSRFTEQFEASEIPLTFNFRSSPGLVQIQRIVASAIDANAPEAISRAESVVDGEVAQVWTFKTLAAEAAKVADWINADMLARNTGPRDYGLLVRQTAERFESDIAQALGRHGLHVRNESKQLGRTTVQDLLSEQFSIVNVALLRLAIYPRDPEAWAISSDTLQTLRGVDPHNMVEVNKVTAGLQRYIKALRKGLSAVVQQDAAEYAFNSLTSFIPAQAWKQSFQEYATGDKLEIVIEAFRLHLASSFSKSSSLSAAVDEYQGTQHIPLMTVHKSKGLEYDTMIFLGLDDENWWSYTPRNPDGLATFFVALSRAKQRALFTFCAQRGDRQKIADLYQLLRAARVPEIDF